MADVSKIKTLKIFAWGRPNSPNPRLAAPISSTATTITVTDAPKDETDAVVSVDFLMGITNSDGYTETVLVSASGISADGLTFTGVTRGIDVSGLDYTTSNSALAADHGQDSAVSCVIHPFLHNQWQAALQGTIASGGENWQIGNEADNDITVYAANGDAHKPFWRYDSATNKWVFSNDGVSSTDFGTGAGVTGGDGITVTAGDIDVDLTDTTVFKDARTTNEAIGIVTKAADGKIDSTFIPSSAGSITGEIRMWSTASAPSGWLICDNSAVSRATYSDLFAVIGTTYGSGDGSTTFNLPDFRGRTPIGSGTGDASDATAHALASKAGEETHLNTSSESGVPVHSHTVVVSTTGSSSQDLAVSSCSTSPTFTKGVGGNTPADASSAHNNIQPSLAINFIIKT